MNLVGEEVKHKVFGRGVITNLNENKITVNFEKSEKIFLFPDSVPRYLVFLNTSIQEQMERINDEKERIESEKKQKIEMEKEYRNRLYNMKILPNSQVAYNVLTKEISDLKYVETGVYLSGNMKGVPRIPVRIQPSSALILTYCNQGDEDSRKIIGIAMADDKFWGKECKDGHIVLHEKYQMMLPKKQQLLFWEYFNRIEFPANWGSVPFKYTPSQVVEDILLDICQNAVGTEKENESMEIYRYFCKLNRIAERFEKESPVKEAQAQKRV